MDLVRPATLSDVKFLEFLQRKNTKALGFIPRYALERRVERNHVFLAFENGEPAAFALFDVVGRGATIHQTACMEDAKRRRLCLRLASRVRQQAGIEGASVVRLACADDLDDAQAFWDAAGFPAFAERPGGAALKRRLILREAPALSISQPDLLEMPYAQLPSGGHNTMAEYDSGARRYSRKQGQRLKSFLDFPDAGLFAGIIEPWDLQPKKSSVVATSSPKV